MSAPAPSPWQGRHGPLLIAEIGGNHEGDFEAALHMTDLAIASGAGGISRQVMGSTVIGGMLAASFIAIFIIPVTFYVVEKLGHKGDKPPPASREANDMGGDGHA